MLLGHGQVGDPSSVLVNVSLRTTSHMAWSLRQWATLLDGSGCDVTDPPWRPVDDIFSSSDVSRSTFCLLFSIRCREYLCARISAQRMDLSLSPP